MLVVALWAPERVAELAGWTAAQGLAVLLRAGLLVRYARRQPADAELGRWTAAFAAGAAASGLLWGSSALLFLDPSDPLSALAVSFAIAGMAAGGLTTLSSHPPSFLLFLLGSIGPLVAVLAGAGDRLHLSLTAMVVVFGAALIVIASVLKATLQQVLDLTEDKQRLLDTMEAQVQERTAALAGANARLQIEMAERKEAQRQAESARADAERANLAKSKFLAAASHDLRQPAQSLVLFTSALSAQLQDHPARRVVSYIEQTSDALRALLDSLLDISRLDAGTIVPRVGATPLAPILDRLATEYALRAIDKGLSFRVAPSSAWCLTDPALLDRILRNLVENALRYTDRGKILLGCRQRGNDLEIQVVDTGIGIARDQLDTIFEEFVQVGNPARDRSQGLGLGLAIVKRLAQMLGHQVSVESRQGRGSRFSITLQMAATPDITGVGRELVTEDA